MSKITPFLLLVALSGLCCLNVHGEGLEASVQTKVDQQLQQIQLWAKDPVIVKAVKDHNVSQATDQAAMTQEKWATLIVLDPWVRAFSKNEAGVFLKSKRTECISEAFISGADGLKVGFLSKPTNWSHKGKAKHEVALTGKTWQGAVELDDSTGLQQVQVSVPIMDGDKPIGSLVVGLTLSKLAKD